MSLNNQFYEHPQPNLTTVIIGAGAAIQKAMVTGQDYLLIPPPSTNEVSRAYRALQLINTTDAEIPAAGGGDFNFQLVLKGPNNTEAVVSSTDSAIAAESFFDWGSIWPWLFQNTDLGLYLRVVGPDITGLAAIVSFDDLRFVEGVFVSLTEAQQTVLVGADNAIRRVNGGGDEGDAAYLFVMNFDSVPHDVALFLTDGTDILPLNAATIPANTGAELQTSFPPYLAEGWSLLASLGEAVEDAPCQLRIGYVDLNLYPVRRWQGGAY